MWSRSSFVLAGHSVQYWAIAAYTAGSAIATTVWVSPGILLGFSAHLVRNSNSITVTVGLSLSSSCKARDNTLVGRLYCIGSIIALPIVLRIPRKLFKMYSTRINCYPSTNGPCRKAIILIQWIIGDQQASPRFVSIGKQ
ncbi:uncharacterized protein P174DRAFT_154259 [Aspergillus novofumigatus IBT 16806]|uniref:Uncharacterized protein n=1 Tax=Aspergillus novofumigatus (strain IBT 16806) TaxID=1392255 RepID=A0A2I1CEW8_ASPN1|nr:uncharacterized protein P174DRAFT_154259 [Aspergillus novofumigatus IBT 16806]PKX96154.1 hypothetical protein P174DRAFT_154259 [Aspergillus novofumigatus IBT 16806]